MGYGVAVGVAPYGAPRASRQSPCMLRVRQPFTKGTCAACGD